MVRLTFLWSDLKTSHTAIFGILDYVSNELFFDNKKVFINDILLIVKFILFYHSFYLWWKIVCLFFLQNLSNKKQDMLKLRNHRESVSLIKNKLYILYMSLLQRNMFFFCFLFCFCFQIEIHSMKGWTVTTRHGVTRKRNAKRLRDTGNLKTTINS